jgi:heterodisulfide reductase subunit A-like polyferredoxin
VQSVADQDDISSYYTATANDPRRYPALEGTVKADVCVIGGGFSGVATALTMASAAVRSCCSKRIALVGAPRAATADR